MPTVNYSSSTTLPGSTVSLSISAVICKYLDPLKDLHLPVEEFIFREQLQEWWTLAHDLLPKYGPESIPKELRCFPGVIFQILAIVVQFLPTNYDPRLDELRFGPSQTFSELSKEYSDCGVAIAKLLGHDNATFIGVQHSLLRDIWLCHSGHLMQAWEHSGKTVLLAKSLKLHIGPEVSPSSRPEELLDSLWTNEQRKRLWLNLLLWDNVMAVIFGWPMSINTKDCSVKLPVDCHIPKDRLQRVPVGRSHSDAPTPLTERLLHYQMTLRFRDLKELESEGPIPKDPEKVKELHRFGLEFQKSIPSIYQSSNPDKKWDAECPFVPL